jgi:hypothetical protein
MSPVFTELPEIARVEGKFVFPVPWREADAMQNYFYRHGVPSIACWDPIQREARLEILPGVDEGRVREVLHEWLN